MNNKSLLTFGLASILAISGCNEKRTLHVYNWSDYISAELIESFQQKYDCKVVVDTFDSNEMLYAKLKAGSSGYDLIFPSSYQVDMLAREDLLEKLDHSKIPEVITNFDHSYDNQILDKELKYSVPYVVTYTGFLCAKDKVQHITNSWEMFGREDLKNKITMLDDIREVIGAGLMYNGFSINSTSQKEIDIAVQTVLKWKPNFRKFDSESYRTEVAGKSTYLGHGYSSDSAQVILGEDGTMREDIVFVLPREGFCVAFDEMAIMKNSVNKDLAYAFIDYLYETSNALENMNYVCGVMPHKNAIPMLSEEMKKMFILPEDTMKKGQVLRSFGDDVKTLEMYNRSWDQIKSTKN